ncbi:response regulator [uncultured Friedmanniella sp.]|uniref:response regulator n=1 Tax=uncultured Friedmanniella sp. TaxID=335381 RepID=UPI0035C9F443
MSAPGNGLRVVLADDQAMVRSGLALVLSSEPDIDVVAECADGRELVRAVGEYRPDLVLTDVRMPAMDGIEAARQLRRLSEAPPILVLTTFDDDEVLWPALAVGVEGFVLKDSPAESLVAAARAVARGGTWLDPRVLPRVVARAVSSPVAAPAAAQTMARLTPREREVLDSICLGASNAEIAGTLRTTKRTVKSQVSSILQKLGARDRAAAIITAYEAGWRRPPG